jgi:hypothetical protein
MADEVFMDTTQVRGMARFFGDASDGLLAVSRALEVLSATLKATAFVGLVGGYAAAFYIDQIKPRVDTAAQKMEEINGDLNSAVDAYQNGDELGSTRFH